MGADPHIVSIARGRALLLLLGVLGAAHAIYPDGHFDYATKVESQDQLSTLIDETIAADQTLMVRWIASAG